ncbi:MAG: Chromosome partition protein Smc [Chlamydiales bacterium]|nr:Chromosome partition protein Smc [Chlamydiales bacterium]MCH9619409.1 Chromosome partition protein Smc [Chlamydiales bacterium]MCH9622213.1 Chromosome partition protein Smc [Chlamydiales bacterium]
MRLKKLKIIGFKSFADRITIDFDGDVIGVVGPNGCGKSNIVDAFRWVMGEQSAKSLRGGKMHDVLFAGTEKRRGLNFAEVSVTLSDVGEGLATPYEEVTITRRLHRDGESEYLINRQPVRLKDVQNLFLGSGIGKNAFSIFEQGKIERIINLPPVQRRSIFDDAAGIGRFLERKKETLRKLSQVDENYMRLKDLHGEVERQTRVLKRQAEAAKNYAENKKRLVALDAAILITRLKKIEEGEEQQKLGELEKTLADEQKVFDLLDQKVVSLKKEVKALEEKAALDREQLYQAESRSKISEAEFERQKERCDELTRREGDLVEQQAKLATVEEKKEQIALLSSQIDALKEELDGFRELKDERGLIEQIAEYRAALKETVADELLQEKSIAKRATLLTSLLGQSLFPYNQTVVVENQKDFAFVLSYAKKRKISNFSLLSLEKVKGGKKGISAHFLGEKKMEETKEGDFVDHLGVLHCHRQVLSREELLKRVYSLEEELTALRELLSQRRHIEVKRQKLEMTLVSENFAYQRVLEERKMQQSWIKEELEEVRATLLLTRRAIETRGEGTSNLSEELGRFQSAFGASMRKLEEGQKVLADVETNQLAARDRLKVVEKELHAKELLIAQASALKSELEHELASRHQMTLQEAPEQTVDDLQQAEAELKQLRSQVERAGAVNLAAIEEFKVQEERHASLDVQLKDLFASKEDLEKIILDLDQESRRLFKETFGTIRENFQRNFKLLFNGGEADLKFTESKDILEAGIEIVAKPPGKQMRSITLLSGGEKCLTALALLFSIFEVKPAPFCILDEVDAPLDDTNVERFTAMLKEYVNKTQFIVVTHNKKTMKVADILIGVSMEEKGVSKLLSLTFERSYADRNSERV